MARRPHDRRFEAAISTIELLLGAVAFAIVVVALAVGFTSVAHAARAAAFNDSGKAAAQAVVDALSRDCTSAIACFIPSNDVGNHANTDGHEVAFYTRDAHGVGKFWSYCYRAKGTSNCAGTPLAGSVTLYGPYAWSDLPQNGGAGVPTVGAIAQNITSISATTITASQLLDSTKNPTTAGVFQLAGYTSIVNVQRQTGYPGVIAGNNVTIVHIATEGLTREVHLLAGARPTHVTTVIGQITPPPNALVTIGSGTNIVFANPIAAQITTGVAESGYGTRTTTPPQVYIETSNSCGGDLNGSATATLTPATDGTGDASFWLQPQVHTAPNGESCTIAYTDNMNQVATFHVTVGQTYTPNAVPGAGSYMSGNVVTFTASEQNYAGASGNGSFTAATTGACAAPSLVSETMSGTTYIATYQAGSMSNGTCGFTATDVYGQQATTSTLVIAQQAVCSTNPLAGTTVGTIQYVGTTAAPPCANPIYAISVSPTVITNAPVNAWSSFTATATLQNPQQAPGAPATSPLEIVNGQGPCSFQNAGWFSSPAGFAADPSNNGAQCTVQVEDQNGDTPVTVTITAGTCPAGYTGIFPTCNRPPQQPLNCLQSACRVVEAAYVGGGGIDGGANGIVAVLQDGTVLGVGGSLAATILNWTSAYPQYHILQGTNCAVYGSEGLSDSGNPIDSYPPIFSGYMGVPYSPNIPGANGGVPLFSPDAAAANSNPNSIWNLDVAAAQAAESNDAESTEIAGYQPYFWWQDELCDP